MSASGLPTSTRLASRAWLAPGTTTIWFSPASLTRISAMPVLERTTCVRERSTPARRSSRTASVPNSSSPTAPTKRTCAPSRAAATAWFAPLPPGTYSRSALVSVSPGRGSFSTRATRSRLIEPTTATLGGKRAQIVEAAVEQVLAEVEEAGPERVAVRYRLDSRRVGKPLERAHEDCELEVGVRDAVRSSDDAGALQDGVPFEHLPRPRLAVPGAPLGATRLELEQETTQRVLQAGQGCLGALRGPAEGRLAPLGSRRVGLAARPALE